MFPWFQRFLCGNTSRFAVDGWGVCQDFSHRGSFWRPFFASVALWAGKDERRAYFEWRLTNRRLQGAIVKRDVNKVCTLHGIQTNKTKNKEKIDVGSRWKRRGGKVNNPCRVGRHGTGCWLFPHVVSTDFPRRFSLYSLSCLSVCHAVCILY